ncbi:hypothetical protein ANCDUO_10884 [Ancylostoma duodenale]|uniref:Uncharacterized protein n=1 Tax=Ancylostoma duodenale TaxID=51022 RepID=A0A0C2GPM8_9BILA|nr:hypothetical protein ANCDUO_10884 [Ancylostoma duodenale]
MVVSCDVFGYGHVNNDRITVDRCNTLGGAGEEFRREWFRGDDMVRREKNHRVQSMIAVQGNMHRVLTAVNVDKEYVAG